MTNYSNYTALIVDDAPLNVELIGKMLKPFHFNLRTADGGIPALSSIAEKKPDIILLDGMMPDLDGIDVLKKVRANEATKDIRVIMVSARVSNDDIAKAFQAGADDYLVKPVILEQLYALINKNMDAVIEKNNGKTAL